jgi:DNA ligase 4
MYWLTQIILKHLKVNASEATFFKVWHPQAQDYYNTTGMSLRAVFNNMDKEESYVLGIEPGKPISPQLARAVLSPEIAYKKMHDTQGSLRPYIIETKFDGERIQVHVCDDGSICYFSRRAIDHGKRSSYSVMDSAIRAALGEGVKNCILDGELVVWDRSRAVFQEFGRLKPAASAACQGLGPEEFLKDEFGTALDQAPKVKVSGRIVFVFAFSIFFFV